MDQAAEHEVHKHTKNKKGRGQYPTFLPKRAWPKNDFLHGFTVNDDEQVTGIFCVHKVVNLN